MQWRYLDNIMINQDKVFQLLTEIEEKNIPNKLMVNNLNH
jgi:hypothetical protein